MKLGLNGLVDEFEDVLEVDELVVLTCNNGGFGPLGIPLIKTLLLPSCIVCPQLQEQETKATGLFPVPAITDASP